MIRKLIFFSGHLLLIQSSLFFIYKPILLLNGITIISWYFNNNKCILTQMEDYFFEETLIDYYNAKIGVKQKINNRFTVPWYHRYFMYGQFLVGILYHYTDINLLKNNYTSLI